MGTMHNYTEEILKIPEATPHGCKQLVTDIGKMIQCVNKPACKIDLMSNILK